MKLGDKVFPARTIMLFVLAGQRVEILREITFHRRLMVSLYQNHF